MKPLLILLALLAGLLSSLAAPIPPGTVAVLYNSTQPESKNLALHYATQRNIPTDNLVGLPLSADDLISRDEYNTTLRDPLLKIFHANNWWTLDQDSEGNPRITNQKIRILLTIRGVPFGIKGSPADPAAAPEQPGTASMQDDAALDSELTLLAVENHPIKGALNNPYFKSEQPITAADLSGFLLVARLDGPSDAICKRMIDDAIAVEQEGLWGMCYLDLARKTGAYQVGDDWINAIAQQNSTLGIPTVIDRNHDTFVTNYPMRDAALYYGWYSAHRNGPLLNDAFRFKRGAIAVHLHSFSATKLRDANSHWTGPLLDKGAAATVGNVFEPYLQMTHHFDLLHDRLLKGRTLVEAAYMAMPALSWQGVVLGDPLYRPFAHLSDPGTNDPDLAYKSLRNAWLQWTDAEERVAKIRTAAARTNSGLLYESLGLFFLQDDKPEQAAAFFNSASLHYQSPSDRLRQELHIVDLLRQSGQKPQAIAHLRTIQATYADLPEGKAIIALLNILDPPAPPPAQPSPQAQDKAPKNSP